MVGDATHAVPILGGHGANMAILDAVDLADVLGGDQGSMTQIQEFCSVLGGLLHKGSP